jgi:small subunit ribosomal protein S15
MFRCKLRHTGSIASKEEYKMARMHSRKKGKSGSTRPTNSEAKWVNYKDKEVEKLIIKYAKEGNSASKIGIILRDKYGIPDAKAVTKKTVTKVLEENKLTHKLPEDLVALIRRALQIRKHMEENKQDMPAKRGLQLTESKIKRLVKYYKRTGKVDQDWKYDPRTVRVLVQ